VKALGLLLILCLGAVGCAPPYIAELNSSAALTRQMTMVGSLGPLNPLGGSSQATIRFLPVKPTAASIGVLSIQSGFAVTEYAGSDYLQFAYVDSSGQPQLTSTNTPAFSLAGADPNYPLYEFDVTTTTATANIVVVSPNNPLPNSTALYSATLPTGPLTLFNSTNSDLVFFAAKVLGVQMVPQPGIPDLFNFLLWDGSSSWAEGSAAANVAGSVFTAGPVTGYPLLSIPVRRALYYRNPLGTLSYASYFLGGKWICDQWSPTTPPVALAGVSNRIDALLSSGDLLSTEGGILRLYDPNGTQVESVALGGLQFCYEAYVGSTPYVFFSLALNLGHDNLMFRVYAVPTSSMRSLGG